MTIELHSTLHKVNGLLRAHTPPWYTRSLAAEIEEALRASRPVTDEVIEGHSSNWNIRIDETRRLHLTIEPAPAPAPDDWEILPLAPLQGEDTPGFSHTPDPALADKLRDLALKMQEQIDGKINTSLKDKPPTAKRERDIERMVTEGRRLLKIQAALLALATCWREGTVPPLLRGLTSRAVVDDVVTNTRFSGDANFPKRMEKAGIKNGSQFHAARELLLGMLDSEPVPTPEERQLTDLLRKVQFAQYDGYFPTPPDVVERMLAAADIEEGMRVLEPSAGSGEIADAIRDAHPDALLHCVELVWDLCRILELKGHNTFGRDFLEMDSGEYDVIVMNPPFEKGRDIDHIHHAYEHFLMPGGRLVALVSAGSLSNSNQKATLFQEWLSSVGFAEELPDGAFKKSKRPTGVKVFMIVVDKPEE